MQLIIFSSERIIHELLPPERHAARTQDKYRVLSLYPFRCQPSEVIDQRQENGAPKAAPGVIKADYRAYLFAFFLPEISAVLHHETPRAGRSAVLPCPVEGSPKPGFSVPLAESD